MNTGHLLNLMEQTAQLRFSPRWHSVRQLLARRGLPSDQMVLCSCDHAGGADMSAQFGLPDGSTVECILRKEDRAADYTSIIEWNAIELTPDEMILVKQITTISDVAAAFDLAVKSFYGLYSRCR